MFAGFDFGTSNCAIGIVNNGNSSNKDERIQLLPINQGQAFMPSALYSLKRELVCESVALQITDGNAQENYKNQRKNQLAQALNVRRIEDILAGEQTTFIGQEAFDQYLSFPDEGYFVKSVKSFLGVSGLRKEAIHFFEDIVTAMMIDIKSRAEKNLGKSIDETVIGRPVNFQGLNAEESNRRAIDILTTSAERAGFKSVEFLFEPLAAGFDFEEGLNEDKTVLIVDVGGGTTDCAMVQMGPSHRDRTERTNDFLGHSGERIGGNDFDIQLAGKNLMPLFGINSELKNGQPMPKQAFWNAVHTNSVGAQSIFNDAETGHSIKQFLLDTTEPELIKRFIKLRKEKQNHHLVRSAEQCKIALSSQEEYRINLDYIEQELDSLISREQFSNAVKRPISKIINLMEEAINQADCQPDFVYITGGSAKSQIVRRAIEQKLGKIEVVDGDHFGSVAKGLTVWAQRLFS